MAKSLGNMRSMKRLDDIRELDPLRDVMTLMREALTSIGNQIEFVFLSGQHKGGWMGFSLNSMDYFFAIYYTNPEAIVFNTYSYKIDESKLGFLDSIINQSNRDQIHILNNAYLSLDEQTTLFGALRNISQATLMMKERLMKLLTGSRL